MLGTRGNLGKIGRKSSDNDIIIVKSQPPFSSLHSKNT